MASVVAKREGQAASADVSAGPGGCIVSSQRHIGQISIHPIPQLQGPFEESISETRHTAQLYSVELGAQKRRRDLLETSKYERLCGRKWRQRAGEQ